MAATIQQLQACEQEVQQLQAKILESVQAAQQPTLFLESKKTHALSPKIHLEQRRLLKGHFGKIYAMQWAEANPHMLCSAAQDGSLLIWDAHAAIRKQSIPLDSPWVMSCSLSPTSNATMVACGGLNNVISIFRTNNGLSLEQIETGFRIPPLYNLQGHDGYISSLRWTSDNNILSSSGDGTCILWDVPTQTKVAQFEGHCGDVMSLSACPTGQTFVSGSIDRTCRLWDTRLEKKKQSVAVFFGHNLDVNAVSFLRDGNGFVSGGDDATIRLFDIKARQQLQKFEQHGTVVSSVATSASGRYVFSGHDSREVISWCTITGAALQNLDFNDHVSSVGVNSDGRAIACASWDSSVKVYG